MPKPDAAPLSDEEFDFLELFLDRIADRGAMNLETVDGFLVALACSPELVKPSEYIPMILGKEADSDEGSFESVEEAERFMKLLMTHWNHILRTFREDKVHYPLFLEDADGNAPGNDWAEGFTRGMKFQPAKWSELLEDEEHGGALVPIFVLANENHPDPEMRPYEKPIDQEQRERLHAGLAVGAKLAYRYFERHRQMNARAAKESSTFRRDTPKIGRNAPCPCGSGKKFKQCCGKTLLH